MRVERVNFKAWICLVILGLFTLDSSLAVAKTVSDPNHKGWSGKHPRSKQVQWKPIKTKCEKCTQLTEQYNQTIQALLNSRYWANFWRTVQKNREAGKADPFWPGKGDINEFEARAVAANLELMEVQQAQLELHKARVRMLEQQASYLAAAIKECEQTACQVKKPTKTKRIKIGGETTKTPWQPNVLEVMKQYGINWNGPYTTRCQPCLPIVKQLNALPGWVVRAHMRLQGAESLLQYAKYIAQSNSIKLDYLKYTHPDKTDYSKLETQVTALKQELAALKRLFNKLIADLSACEAKYCVAIKSDETALLLGEDLSTCPSPSATTSISVGANNDVGSKANFKDKAKKKAAGLATKAITGLLGIGGGGGNKSSGPSTYKDPVKKKRKVRVRNKPEKRDLLVGGVFTDNGLLISTNIKKAPGKGTFQTIYLQNPRGWRLAPIGLYLYEIWANWKLSVSWTRETYVDGQLVSREQGGWTESWRELLARGEQTLYGEVPEAPLWEQLGFNTAVSGARGLGTLFPITPEMLANEPINLVVHVTIPKSDPVVTYPYVFTLTLGKKGRVVVEPVEETLAQSGPACDENPEGVPSPSTIPISDTPTTTNPADESPSPADNLSSGNQIEDEGIEEIEVTGRRIRDPELPAPITSDDIPVKPFSNSEWFGSNDTPTESPFTNPNGSSDDKPGELEEIEVTGSRISDYSELDLSRMNAGYGTRYEVGAMLKYHYTADDLPPISYGEEIEEPEQVGIVLKHFNRGWVPAYQKRTFVTAKLYVPESPGSKRWIPHDQVERKLTVTFVSRSNQPGKAMNADLPSGPQNVPDLYFEPQRNPNTECRMDPSGLGHFGTCSTNSEVNSYEFTISNDDYGSFSKLDATCPGCVQLTPVAGVYPESFERYQRWEVAVEEPNQLKRAVSVPLDTNNNQIADGYPPEATAAPSATEDLENTPVGNGQKGDGLSAYEEYRGFVNRHNRHQRTDWNTKTILIENLQNLSTFWFGHASGLEVLEIDDSGHKNRIVNYNHQHAHEVDQHGLILAVEPSLDDDYAGYCFCDLDRPKGARRVTVKKPSASTGTIAHELGHAVGMRHHGDHSWPGLSSIRAMTGGIKDLLPGRVHSGPSLCGKTLPAEFRVGTKGDQGSGHHECIMKYEHYHYVYEQDGGDYDCMPAASRMVFDTSNIGTGPNRMNRTAANADRGDCMSQLWINSK